MRKFISAAIAAILFVTTPSFNAVQAGNYGFSNPLKRLKVPRVVPRIDKVPGAVIVGPGDLPIYGLRRTLGVFAVATIGVAVLGVMSAAEQRDVARRTARLVSRDLEREVVDTYTIKKGKKRVTIRLSPAQKKPAFQDDPALKPPTDPNAKPPGDDPNQKEPDVPAPQVTPGGGGTPEDPKKPAGVAEEGDGRVAIDTVPVDTDCRRMTVEVADAGTTKTDAAPMIEQSNTTIVCKMSDKDWKPVTK